MMESAETARAIIDANLYMVLGTADASGVPWASPVYFAVDGYRDFYWVSRATVTHSRNIATRPQVSIVVFDSSVLIGTGQGVYMRARAEALDGDEMRRGIEIFSERSVRHGGYVWTPDDVEEPALLRLYLARVSEHSMLAKDGTPDHRVSVDLFRDGSA